jgi:hypothetical protein
VLGQPVAPRTLGRSVDVLSTAFGEGPSHSVIVREGLAVGAAKQLKGAWIGEAELRHGATRRGIGTSLRTGWMECGISVLTQMGSRNRQSNPAALQAVKMAWG